ncbi:splicing factor Spf30 [Schizosaccharomyces cryophilus OY26]|uniref:Splicing factor Spf30 n=1 Tax=Schizosaccharomyces cryophilus (strain OY26 / ATCC MYA-4695 / CBS 11777 / NBRC 106824 / NRRL Y48691) TaxID=653667 RepID=S9W240_SCHCR|nr:splicing factor Spf30 [Schizosaccharomyces cryophilus OY26]EPY52100.1 splicing factor Spf30 [Schizosaccharomyces cryophilus OY26]
MEDEYKQYQSQLALVKISLEKDPDNQELLALKNDLEELVDLTGEVINEKGQETQKQTKLEENGFSAVDSKSMANAQNLEFFPGDLVMARWTSGDYAFYAGKITAVSGYGPNKKYTIQFLDYPEVETVSSKNVKAMPEAKRRNMLVMSSSLNKAPRAGFSPNPTVSMAPSRSISPMANSRIHPSIASPERAFSPATAAGAAKVAPVGSFHTASKPPPPTTVPEPPAISTPPPPIAQKPKTQLKPNAALEASKNSWKQFASRGVKTGRVGKRKKIGETSMFRSPEDAAARVGFMGNGRGATKPASREKHVYNYKEDEDYE